MKLENALATSEANLGDPNCGRTDPMVAHFWEAEVAYFWRAAKALVVSPRVLRVKCLHGDPAAEDCERGHRRPDRSRQPSRGWSG